MSMGNQIILGTPFYLILAYVVIFPGLAAFFLDKGISIIGANRAGNFFTPDADYGRNHGDDILVKNSCSIMYLVHYSLLQA